VRRDRLRQAGQQHGHPGDVAVVLAGLVRRAEDHLVHLVRVDAGPAHHLTDDQRGQVVGPHARQRAAVPPHRGADAADQVRLSHRATVRPGDGERRCPEWGQRRSGVRTG
jgi:hypothetical protein